MLNRASQGRHCRFALRAVIVGFAANNWPGSLWLPMTGPEVSLRATSYGP